MAGICALQQAQVTWMLTIDDMSVAEELLLLLLLLLLPGERWVSPFSSLDGNDDDDDDDDDDDGVLLMSPFSLTRL